MKKIIRLSAGLCLLFVSVGPAYGWPAVKPDFKLLGLFFGPEIPSRHWNSDDCDYRLGQVYAGVGKELGRGWQAGLKIGLGVYAENDGRSKRGIYADGILEAGKMLELPFFACRAKASAFVGLAYLGPRHGWYSVNGSRPLGIYGASFGPVIKTGGGRDLMIALIFKHGSGFPRGDKGFNVLGVSLEYRFFR